MSSGLEVEHGLERLELGPDELGCVSCRRFGLGDDDRDRLACVDDLLARERLAGAARAGRLDLQIRRGQDLDHAGRGARLRRLDRNDPRVSFVREHEPSCSSPTTGRSSAKRVSPRTLRSES